MSIVCGEGIAKAVKAKDEEIESLKEEISRLKKIIIDIAEVADYFEMEGDGE